jgi:hypothetical protein
MRPPEVATGIRLPSFRSPFAIAALAVSVLAVVWSAAPAARGAITPSAAHPVVVELFQSQGCSSCPPANANLNLIADRPEILALSFAVTYWDDLGWRDTFASAQFTERQWDYARGLQHDNVATPQVILNGRRDIVGADRDAFNAAVAAAGAPQGPDVTIARDVVSIGAGTAPAPAADVWLVRYDPRVRDVPIQRGENGGKTLAHRNVVTQLRRLGRWRGAPARFTLPAPADSALRTAILVQSSGGGPILAAVKQ